MRANALRVDPTRTTVLRGQFVADVNRRFARVEKAIKRTVLTEDDLGLLLPGHLVANAQRWRFLTVPGKLRAFQAWLRQQFEQDVLQPEPGPHTRPWLAKYIESAYRKGVVRAFVDAMRGRHASASPDFAAGARAEFLRSSFAIPEMASKIELIYTRAYSSLKGITAAMDTQISRTLADGLANGAHPLQISRALVEDVDGLTRLRARALARTEVIHAHAEGQLDSFEELGVEELGIDAEWMTARDGHVCRLCAALAGAVFTIKEARGLLPRHPNCRCCWRPANIRKGQKRDPRATRLKLRASVRAERPNAASTAAARKESRWAGADVSPN